MNTVKKIIAFSVVIFISSRLIVISVSASFAAPVVAAEEITTVLETALIGSGLYTESELEGKSYLELNDLLRDGINSGHIDPKKEITYYRTPDVALKFSIMEAMTDPEIQAEIGAKNARVAEISDNAFTYWWNYNIDNGADLYDFINPTYTEPVIDLQGSGAVLKLYYRNRGSADAEIDRYRIVYCEYVEVQDVGDGTYNFYCRNPVREVTYNLKGELQDVYDLNGQFSSVYSQSKVGDNFSISGDCRRLDDGSQIDTTVESIPVIGEAGGTQVTPDMLNPDGTVTIDGTTYYPKDFIDWDKFKDTAIIDLLNEILKALDNSYVIDDSVPDIGFDDATVDVPAELSDFTTLGIFNVFPFCLPKDFVRGMYLFKSKPEVPHFETEIKIPAFLNVPEQKWKIEIDFKEFEPLAKITRWISLTSFVYVLILITPKIVKGAG